MTSFLFRTLGAAQDLSTRMLFGKETGAIANSLFDIVETNMKGDDVPLSKYKGDVLCVVNVASQ